MIRDGAVVILIGAWVAAIGYGLWILRLDIRDYLASRRVS